MTVKQGTAVRHGTARPVGVTRSVEPARGRPSRGPALSRSSAPSRGSSPSRDSDRRRDDREPNRYREPDRRRDSDRHREPAPPDRRRPEVYVTTLSGFHQVPPVWSEGTGTFRAEVSEAEDAITYELTFSGLSTPTVAAHIHFGHPTDNGGIVAFLCGGGNGPACPPTEGTVQGTITAEDIAAIPEQGLAAGDLAAALRIIREGLAYVNVHTEAFPDGEIRGQLRRERGA